MITYRISKYDPAIRDANGHYTDQSEWTSISDILEQKASPNTYTHYQQVEDAYVSAVDAVMHQTGIESLMIDALELYTTPEDIAGYAKSGRLQNLEVDFEKDLKALHNGLWLSFPQLNKVIRLILRETVWMQLRHKNLEIRFGYDYYMYFITQPLYRQTIEAIESSGLFVEILE